MTKGRKHDAAREPVGADLQRSPMVVETDFMREISPVKLPRFRTITREDLGFPKCSEPSFGSWESIQHDYQDTPDSCQAPYHSR